MKTLIGRMDHYLDEVNAMLLDKVKFLARDLIQNVATLLLEDHFISLVDNLSDADNGALNGEVIKFNHMSLTFNANLDINNFVRFHGIAICEDALPGLSSYSSLVPRKICLGFRGMATSATVHHSIYLALLESLIVRRCKVRRRVV